MIKIISDSSSDLFQFEDVPFASVPLKVRTSVKEYVDNGPEEVKEMCDYLSSVKEKTSSSCPNAAEWLDAFAEDDDNICFTISSNLSGSYNSCLQAKQIYEEEHDHKVVIIDTLTAGAEERIIIEKAAEYILQGLKIDEIEEKLHEYQDSVHTYFLTSSVQNLVSNGRIPSFVGKAISILKISMVGMGSDEGRIKIVHESRTSRKAIDYIVERMIERGYTGGKFYMSTCLNTDGVEYFRKVILEKFPEAKIQVLPTGILCSYYVEENGIILGFEGNKE